MTIIPIDRRLAQSATECFPVDIHKRIPLFKQEQQIFEKEQKDIVKQSQSITLGNQEGFEDKEKHLVDAVQNQKQIPTKRKSDHHIPRQTGAFCQESYYVYQPADSTQFQNILYDLHQVDYDFLDNQKHPFINEDTLCWCMMAFDLMFPAKYRNVWFRQDKATHQIYQALIALIRDPVSYCLPPFPSEDQEEVPYDAFASMYNHFGRVRIHECGGQPIIYQLREKHKLKSIFLPFMDKKQMSGQRIKNLKAFYLCYNMLGEYVAARELLNTYYYGQKYYENVYQLTNKQEEKLQTKTLNDMIYQINDIRIQLLSMNDPQKFYEDDHLLVDPPPDVRFQWMSHMNSEEVQHHIDKSLSHKSPYDPNNSGHVQAEIVNRRVGGENKFAEFVALCQQGMNEIVE